MDRRVARPRRRRRRRRQRSQGDYFFFSFLPCSCTACNNRRGYNKEGERCCLIQVEEGEEKEAQHRRVGLETLAGRLSRRGGSTPPEGDFELRVYGGGKIPKEGKVGQRASRGKGDSEGIIRGVGTERVERAYVSPPLVSRPRRPPRDCFPWGRHRVSGPSYNTTPSGPTSPELALAEGPVGPPLRPPYILVLPLLDAAKVSSRFSRPRNSIRSRNR